MVKEEKVKEVETLKNLIQQYSAIALIDMNKLPAKQFQIINKNLRGKAVIKIVKKSLLKLAIKASDKPKIRELEGFIPQQPAILLTNLDPFELYALSDNLKFPITAKTGDVAPEDILVPEGPTSLMPGPVISELQKAGIPGEVEEGRITIKKDVVVAKKGDILSKEVATALRKLKIEPIKIGLNIAAMYENGNIYKKDVLELVTIFPDKLREGFNRAISLSVAICYPTKENIKFLLFKAFNSAKTLENKVGGAN